MRANTRFLIFSLAALGLAGCGGLNLNGLTGGGNAPSPNVRQNLAGDNFTYSITGTYSQTGGVQNAATSGSTTDLFASGSYAGQPALSDTATTSLLINGATATIIDGKQLSATNVVLGQTDANVMQVVSSGGFTIPQTLSQGLTLTGTETLANGTTVTLSLTITGTTNISTPVGTFPCWTEIKTLNYSDGFSSTQTIQFAPSIGAPVQVTVVNQYTSGLSENLTLTLASDTLG